MHIYCMEAGMNNTDGQEYPRGHHPNSRANLQPFQNGYDQRRGRRKTIYFIDPAGFEFEFIQYLSENPEEKNMYGGETSAISRVSTAL